jgi:urea transport system substrate-binding protein
MRYFLALLLILIILFETSVVLFDIQFEPKNKEPIKVGLLYASTGYRSSKEILTQQATLMAIEEINQKGGILRRKIIPIIRDSQSSTEVTQRQVESLLKEEKVDVIFGSWMAEKHESIRTLFEQEQKLLFYPFQYEGIVDSSYIIFAGTSVHQQVPPTINYCFEHFGTRFFLVGTEFLFSYIVNQIARDQITARDGEILGEFYLSRKEEKLDDLIQAIVKAKPNVVLSTLLGSDNVPFFKKLREAGIEANQMPVFSFNVSESTLGTIEDIKDFVGHYATWNYFQSINTPINHLFVNSFTNFSKINYVDEAAESAYMCVYLWAKGISEEGKLNVDSLENVFANMRLQAPEGPLTLNTNGKYAWKYSRIGRIQENRQFEILWESSKPIQPQPLQVFRSQEEWQKLVEQFRAQIRENSNHGKN